MKRIFYISAFTLLGVLLQFIIHALVETWYISLLVSDFDSFGLGLSWRNWFLIHHIATAALFILGAGLGLWQGVFWWRKIYIEHKLTRWCRRCNITI